MNQIVFFLLSVAHLTFLYLIINRLPDEGRRLFFRMTELLPHFEDAEGADVKSSLFCISILVFILILARMIFK